MRLILTILRKDLIEFSREKVYLVLSIVGLVMFVAVFWIMPETAGEQTTIGIYAGENPELIQALDQVDRDDGLEIIRFTRADDLQHVIAGDLESWVREDGRLVLRDRESGDDRPDHARRVRPVVGVAFPESWNTRDQATALLYVNNDTPTEIRNAMESMVRELALAVSGAPLPISQPPEDEIILGTDRLGNRITPRERIRPLLAYFVLMMETFALASLIAAEISQRTVLAVIASPAKLSDVLAAKAIHGVALASVQALILLAAVGSFTATNWFSLIVAAVLGAGMFTGIAMLVGSAGRDFIENLFLTTALVIPLAIPAFSVLFPGMSAEWVRFVPSYGIMNILTEVTNNGAAFEGVAPTMLASLAWVAAIFGLGLLVLTRKVRSL
ncbi:MAG: ABC transporter permease [Spirochaetaceae bacterium]